jgi:hypothetical protein
MALRRIQPALNRRKSEPMTRILATLIVMYAALAAAAPTAAPAGASSAPADQAAGGAMLGFSGAHVLD